MPYSPTTEEWTRIKKFAYNLCVHRRIPEPDRDDVIQQASVSLWKFFQKKNDLDHARSTRVVTIGCGYMKQAIRHESGTGRKVQTQYNKHFFTEVVPTDFLPDLEVTEDDNEFFELTYGADLTPRQEKLLVGVASGLKKPDLAESVGLSRTSGDAVKRDLVDIALKIGVLDEEDVVEKVGLTHTTRLGERTQVPGSPDYTLCACGCGNPTLLALRTEKRKGHVKGKPLPYIRGHKAHLRVPYLADRQRCIAILIVNGETFPTIRRAFYKPEKEVWGSVRMVAHKLGYQGAFKTPIGDEDLMAFIRDRAPTIASM